MAITIQPYLPEHEAPVKAFNERLTTSQPDANLVFYSEATPRWLPDTGDPDLRNEYRVALDGAAVRGAYAIKWQKFRFPDGQIRVVGNYHHPLSEGIVDKSYATVGAMLLRDAIARCPLLYCLGMGGYDRPLPRMLIGVGWSHFAVPFYLRIVHPYRFLREMHALRTSPLRRLLMDAGAFSGAGWAAWNVWRGVASLRSPNGHAARGETIDAFSTWSDALWEQSKDAYGLTAVRDGRTLSALYSGSPGNLERLRVRSDGLDAGWAVVGERRANAKFGRMRVGSIVDCWALPGREASVVEAAAAALERRGVDLIVTNQSHARWCRAVERQGFVGAESNFIFAASRRLSELLTPFDANKAHIHVTRADGDGLPDNF